MPLPCSYSSCRILLIVKFLMCVWLRFKTKCLNLFSKTGRSRNSVYCRIANNFTSHHNTISASDCADEFIWKYTLAYKPPLLFCRTIETLFIQANILWLLNAHCSMYLHHFLVFFAECFGDLDFFLLAPCLRSATFGLLLSGVAFLLVKVGIEYGTNGGFSFVFRGVD